MDISITRDGAEIGTWTEEEVRTFYEEGRLVDSDHYWMEGMTEWQKLSNFIKPPPPFPPSSSRVSHSLGAPTSTEAPPWNRLYLIIGLGVALSAIIAAFCLHEFRLSKDSPTLTKSLTAYCGLYRCTETVEGAGRMLLKIYPRSFSFIELQNESDDPATGKEASPNITVQYLKVEDAVARMDGIEQTTTKTIFTTTGDSSNKPSQTGSFTSEDNFTLEWHKGNDGGPDTVTLTILEPPTVFGSHNEEQSVLHFARIQ